MSLPTAAELAASTEVTIGAPLVTWRPKIFWDSSSLRPFNAGLTTFPGAPLLPPAVSIGIISPLAFRAT